MATNFPTSLDNLSNPAGSDPVNNPSHATQHANVNDALEALEAKVGANNSAVTTSHDYKITQLEAAITAGVSGSKSIYQDVRNQSGSSLAKATPVYVTGSDGASGKLLVSAASNAAEYSSSKTMGLTSSTIQNNNNGQVITEGILESVDTTGASDGDPVWLGTNGAKIYGLANKPYAPAHLVFLGIVVRGGQQNTGSIYVKIQNGFEMEELHNVQITSAANGEVLVYDATSGLWKNSNTIASKTYVDNAITSLGNTAANTYVPVSDVGNADGVASLDSNGLIPDSQIPAGIARDSEVSSAISTEVTNRNTAISTAINNLINSAPGTLDTLGEIATVLAADESAAAALTTLVNSKAPINNPTFTGTVGGITKAMVGLGNVDNTTDANKPVSTAQLAALDLKANITDVPELAQDAVGNALSSVFTYNDSTGGIGIDNAQLSNFLLDGASGNSYGLIGTSTYLDVKNSNGYNKEIELDIAAVESKLVIDGFAKLASPTLTGTPLAPTASSGTNTTQIATTAFVKTAIDSSVQPGALYQTSAPTSPAIGQIWIDADDDVTTFDSNIIRRKSFTATAGQTVFVTDIPFIDGFEQVYMNGLLLVKTTDYAVSGGNTVTLTSGAAVSDVIEIVSVTGANSVNTYTQSEVNAIVANIYTKAQTDALLAANTSVAPLSISANTTLIVKKRYFVTSASALTLTLPASPALNDEIQIVDASGNASTYNITVARNANKINGGSNNLIIDTNGGWYTLLYTGSTYGWKVG